MREIKNILDKKYCFGVEEIIHSDDRCIFERFPKPISEYLDAKSEHSRTRAHCPSSVKLRFISNTKKIKIKLQYGGPARPFFKGVLVTNQQEFSFGPDEKQESWEGIIYNSPETNRQTFEIFLPHLCITELLSIEIDSDANIEPAPLAQYQWLAFGDSITQGIVVPLATQSYVGLVCKSLDADVRSISVGGATLDEELAMFESCDQDQFDFISIAYGTNDFALSIPLDTFQNNARKLIESLNEKSLRPIVLISPLTWANREEPNDKGLYLEAYRDILSPLASQYENVHLLNGSELIPNHSKYFSDDVHPNEEGFLLYAKKMSDFVRPLIMKT